MTKKNNLEKFNVLHDNVLIQSIVIAEKKGVFIPQTYETKPDLGKVLKVGEGRILESGTLLPTQIKKGDIVYFNEHLTTKFDIDGEVYLIVREEDIVLYKR